jgi:hypothetical protein
VRHGSLIARWEDTGWSREAWEDTVVTGFFPVSWQMELDEVPLLQSAGWMKLLRNFPNNPTQ